MVPGAPGSSAPGPRHTIRRVQHGAEGLPGRRPTWTAYAYLSVFGFYLYTIGALTPYLRDALGLSDAQAALHPSAMAIGMVSAGTVADVFERRLGTRAAGVLSVALVGVSGAALASVAAFPVTLAGAFGLGLGGGAILSAVNQALGRPGGALAERRFARANAWAILVSLFAPVSVSALASSPLGWRVVPVLPFLVPAMFEIAGGLSSEEGGAPASPASTSADPGDGPRAPGGRQNPVASRLPRGFWIAWAFVIVAVSIEFSYVVWGSSVVVRRTGVSLEAATAIASLFIAGMLIGRLALGAGVVGTARHRRWLDLALLVTAVGGVIVWLSAITIASAAGLLLAGFGTATLYPLGMAAAIGRAGDAAPAAGARLTLASGLAILVAPLALGAISDAFGVVAGWPLVVALCAVGWLVRRAAPA